MKKVEIENKLYSVVSLLEYSKNHDLYNPKSTAVEVNGGSMVLPIKNPMTETGPGVYYSESRPYANIVKPAPGTEADYSASKVIDLSSSRDIGELIRKNNMLRDLQSDLMVSSKDSNIFYLTITPEDTPEMKALKQAINSKQIDKKVYEDRFPQFQNDMRLLKGHSITLSKLISICNGFDISCIMTLRDKEDAANPIGDELTVDLTDGKVLKSLEPVFEKVDETIEDDEEDDFSDFD